MNIHRDKLGNIVRIIIGSSIIIGLSFIILYKNITTERTYVFSELTYYDETVSDFQTILVKGNIEYRTKPLLIDKKDLDIHEEIVEILQNYFTRTIHNKIDDCFDDPDINIKFVIMDIKKLEEFNQVKISPLIKKLDKPIDIGILRVRNLSLSYKFSTKTLYFDLDD